MGGGSNPSAPRALDSVVGTIHLFGAADGVDAREAGDSSSESTNPWPKHHFNSDPRYVGPVKQGVRLEQKVLNEMNSAL